MDFPHNCSLGIKPRKMVKLLRKSFDVSKMRLMFVLKLEMTVTSVILSFKNTIRSKSFLPMIPPLSNRH